jgi:predicted lipoprotein
MNKMLALAGIAALVAACAGIAQSGNTEPERPGAAEAADLGYHGPLHRAHILYGN